MPGIGIGNGVWRSGGKAAAWTLAKLGALFHVRADTGVTYGATQGTIPVALTAWTPTALTVTGTGPYTLTADAGNSAHEIAVAITTAIAGSVEITIRTTGGTAAWLYLRDGANVYAHFDLATGALGTGTGAAFISHHSTPLPGGGWEFQLRLTHVAAETVRIGLSDADGAVSWNAAGTETATGVQVLDSFGVLGAGAVPAGATATVQKRIQRLTDVVDANLYVENTSVAYQPLLGRDEFGWYFGTAGTTRLFGCAALVAAVGSGDVPLTILAATDHAVTSGATKLVFIGNSAAPNDGMEISSDVTPSLFMGRKDSGSESDYLYVNGATFDGVVCARYDGANVLGNANGDTITPKAHSGAMTVTHVCVGCFPTGAYRWNGRVREILIVRRSITDTELSLAMTEMTREWWLTLVARGVGDSQDSTVGPRATTFAALAALPIKPLAVVHAGDLTANIPVQSDYDLFWAESAALADRSWTSRTVPPLYATPGNHDLWGVGGQDLWNANLARQASESGIALNFAVDIGEHVRLISCNSWEQTQATRIVQRDWFAAELAATAAAGKVALALWHHRGVRKDLATNASDVECREWALSLMARVFAAGNAVCPLVLHGHAHVPLITYPMATGFVRDDANGSVFLTMPASAANTGYATPLAIVETLNGEEAGLVGVVFDSDVLMHYAANPSYLGYVNVWEGPRGNQRVLRVEIRNLTHAIVEYREFLRAA